MPNFITKCGTASLIVLLFSAVSAAQVSPEKVAQIAKAVHDAEGVNIGSSSTRDYRNAFWARVIGVVHWGHPVYNPTPDQSWCIKDAGNGRPQSDDVAVKCVTREFWDCIPNSGADGYRFQCSGHGSAKLPAEQNVYPPPKPAGWNQPAPTPVPTPGTPPPPGNTPAPAPVDLQPVLDAVAALSGAVDALDKRLNAILALMQANEATWQKAAHEAGEAAARASDIKTAVEHLPTPEPQKCVSGRQSGWAGGAIRLCPE